jgi:hypothetical protein
VPSSPSTFCQGEIADELTQGEIGNLLVGESCK